MPGKNLSFRWGTAVLILALLFMAGLFSIDQVQAGPPEQSSDPNSENIESESTADHSKFDGLQREFATAPEVTAACLECHTEAAAQIQETFHWTWEKTLETGQLVGKQNVINNFCIALTSNEPRCTSCHAGYGWNGQEPFDFSSETKVDCLICHDTTGTYKKFPAGSGHPTYEEKEFPPGSGKIWKPLDLAYIAQNVGLSSRNNCGACHFYGGGGDGVKHGDMDSSLKAPSKSVDVHMDADGLNFACTECHQTSGHNVPGSRYEVTAVDTHGRDLPESDGNPATCESCHGLEPMQDAKLNDHIDQIACQTCHIPTFARENPTKLWWDWSTAGQTQADGSPIVTKDENGWVTYDTKKGDFIWEMNVVPTYVWFNGKADFTTVGTKIDDTHLVELNAPLGGPDAPDSRIWPMKVFKGKQPYDVGNQTMVIPHLFGKDENAYWKSYDWGKAITAGMEKAGAEYSGEYSFVETQMVWPITHMVAPKEEALTCESCHSENGRLAGLEGIYIPAQSSNNTLDKSGWGLSLLAVVGIVLHGGMRVFSGNKKGKKS